MQETNTYQRGLVGWLSLAQLISWGSIFYTFALIMGPVETELALSQVEGALAYPVGRWIDRGGMSAQS